MSDIATLVVNLVAKDDASAVLARLEAQLARAAAAAAKAGAGIGAGLGGGARVAAGSFLSLQQAQARLEVSQGNLAGAAMRLKNVLAQQTTTTTQTIGAQRQLASVEAAMAAASDKATRAVTLQAQAQARLAASAAANTTASRSLGGHFQALGGAIGGLPGQLLSVGTGIGAVTAAAGVGVAVVNSFGEAFKFKAQLDATTLAINAQIQGVRDSGQVYAEAAKFANTYKLTQEETTNAIAASIGVMRTSKAPMEDILGVLARMQVLSPEQSLQEAAIALKALASGDTTSLVTRFEVGRDVANQMKQEIQGGADAVATMSKFLGGIGIGMDVLATKTVGAAGAMKDLAIAQEDLKLAQAAFAEGPGLVLLEGKIRVISGATRLLSGDFDAMGQSLHNATVGSGEDVAKLNAEMSRLQGIEEGVAGAALAAAAGQDAYTRSILEGGTQAEAVAAQVAASNAVLAQTAPVAVAAATATTQLTGAMSAESAAAAAGSDATAALAAAMAEQIAKTAAASAEAQKLTQAQSVLASIGGAVQSGQITAGQGAIQFAAMTGIAIEKARELLALQAQLAGAAAAFAKADTKRRLGNQGALELKGAGSDEAQLRKSNRTALLDERNARVKASGDAAEAERNYQQTLGNAAPTLARYRSELAQLTKGSAAYINKQNDIAKLTQKTDKAAKSAGGGGGVKLSDQQKLNNSLLASQESFGQKSEDAEQAHLDRVLAIHQDFGDRLRDAQDSLGQSQLDSRAGFYDSLGSIEDDGLRAALSAQYEAAFAEADAIATAKGADVGEKFLEAKQAAIQAQGQRSSDIAEATKEGDKDKAAYLAGVDKLYRDAEARKLATIAAGGDSLAAQRDAQLAEEGTKYDAAQEKLGTAAERAAQRKIDASVRSGQAIDAEGLKIDTVTAKYDAMAVASQRAGVAPGTATGIVPAVTPVPVAAPAAVVPGDDPTTAAILSLRGLLEAIEAATKNAGRDVVGAVRSIPRSVA